MQEHIIPIGPSNEKQGKIIIESDASVFVRNESGAFVALPGIEPEQARMIIDAMVDILNKAPRTVTFVVAANEVNDLIDAAVTDFGAQVVETEDA